VVVVGAGVSPRGCSEVCVVIGSSLVCIAGTVSVGCCGSLRFVSMGHDVSGAGE
jgi:hypothetical protein